MRRRALTRLAALAVVLSGALVYGVALVMRPVHAWIDALWSHAAVKAAAAVDDAQWTCRFRSEPFVQWRGPHRIAMYVRSPPNRLTGTRQNA